MTHLANKLSVLLMASALFAACKSDDPVITADDTAIHIATRVAGQAAADGTSGNKTDYKPTDDTRLYLYYKTMGNTGQGQHAQYAYTAQSGKWATSAGTAPLYWDDLTKQTGADAYPFFAASPQTPATDPAVNADQSTAEAYKTSDQLIAYTATESRRTALDLDLHHILSQLKVTITSTGNANEKLDLSNATLTIKGAKLKYKLTYSGTVQAENNATLTVPCTEAPAIATGTATATPLTPLTGTRTAGTANYTAVVPPQSAALEFVFTINGNEYPKTISLTELKSGYATSFDFTVHKSGVELNSIKLTDWKDAGTAVQAAVTVKLEGEASGAGDGTGTISGTTMNIWKHTGNAETDKAKAHPYTKGTDNKWSSSNPIYVDDTNINADRFYATIDNGTGAITGVHDLIGAGPATMGKGTLNFGFTHLMAQLAVNLKKGTDFPADVDLSTATVSTPTLKTAYTLSYNPSGNALLVTAKADGASQQYKGLATGVSTTTSGAATTTDETAYLVVPQTISTAEEFTVIAGDKTYTGKLSQAMTLEAGKKNVLTLTLTPTGMTVGSITLKDWDPTDSSGSGSVDGVTIPSSSLTNVDQSGTLHLVATTDGTNPATNGHGTYPVAYDADSNTATVNTGDATAYSPILWDHLAAKNNGSPISYIYRALFVPTAYRHTAGATNNHEQDYLTGTSAATPWGTTPDFKTDKTTQLTHALAQLTVTLTSDGTITTDELKTATITTVSKKALTISPENGTLSIGDATQDKTVTLLSAATGNLTKDAIIVPQELQNIVITITIGGDAKTYTVTPDAGANISLEAGKNHTLTARLKRSEMGITVAQTGWNVETLGEKDITVDE